MFGPLGFLWLRYATLQNLIPSFLWIAPPTPPPWRNPRKGRDQILPSGNLGHGTVDIEADVGDAEAVRAAVENCQGVLHAAARHAPHAAHFHAKGRNLHEVRKILGMLDQR